MSGRDVGEKLDVEGFGAVVRCSAAVELEESVEFWSVVRAD